MQFARRNRWLDVFLEVNTALKKRRARKKKKTKTTTLARAKSELFECVQPISFKLASRELSNSLRRPEEQEHSLPESLFGRT